MSIILTPKQEEALRIMKTNYFNQEPVTVIAGVAGSGKSTIVKEFVYRYLKRYTNIKYVAFTGKAALVLRKKGLPATTIHKLIYNAHYNPKTKKYYFTKKSHLEEDIDLIIVDEVSMVSNSILKDLASFKIPIIALGDPMQLEAIGERNNLLSHPDIFLDEVHRQALDNDIIKLSMEVRTQTPWSDYSNSKYVKIMRKQDINLGVLMWADQILAGTNFIKSSINKTVRKALNRHGDLPEVGDKIICLKNYWDTTNRMFSPLVNGMIGYVDKIYIKVDNDDAVTGHYFVCDFKAEGEEMYPYRRLQLDANIFKNLAPMIDSDFYKQFDYAYAITVHKAQGSEWDKVVIFDEYFKGTNHTKWLYTAITRAKEKLVLIRE